MRLGLKLVLLNRFVVDVKRLLAFQRQPSSCLPTLKGALILQWVDLKHFVDSAMSFVWEHVLKQWTSDHKWWVNLARFPQLLNLWIPWNMIRRYVKLIDSLLPMVNRAGLDILPLDLAMILLRSLKPAVRQYLVMHSICESYADIRLAALRYESAQRLWQEVSPNPKNPDFYTLPAEGKGNEKGKGDKEGTRQGQQGFECNRQRYWDHIGSKTKFSGTLVKLVTLAVIASRNLRMMPNRKLLVARKMMAKAKTKVMERRKLAKPLLRWDSAWSWVIVEWSRTWASTPHPADFLDLSLLPDTSTTCTCWVCAVQTTSECATQPVNVLDDHV